MSKIYPAHIQIAKQVVESYAGDVPLHIFLKKALKEFPQAGSKDRKSISNLVYSYYRVGNTFSDESFEARLEWLAQEHQAEQLKSFFWFSEHISPNIDQQGFLQNMLQNQRVFFRAYLENDQEKVLLEFGAIHHKNHIYSLEAQVNIEALMQQLAILDSQWVIQDMASASTVEMVDSSKKVSHWWDACCGAGGKSLLWYKHFPGVQITATDIRSSILNNYQERMKRYRFAHNTYVWDAYQQVNPKRYEGVIADVPCTGSGTWARTPEAHYFFKAEQLDFYPKLQKQILKNLSKSLDPGAQLIYITCSVFEQENEAILKYAEESLGLCVEEMKYFQCSEIKGDTLFAARLVLR